MRNQKEIEELKKLLSFKKKSLNPILTLLKELRPFQDKSIFSNKNLYELTDKHLSKGLIELPTLINTEIGFHRRNTAGRQNMAELFTFHKLKPIKWLFAVRKELRKIHLNQKFMGDHHVYTILLNYPNGPRYGVYVGESEFNAEQRFSTHLEGGFTAASSVKNFGIEILYSLFMHLKTPGPGKEYAKKIEARMAKRLKKDYFKPKGLPPHRVKGGTKQF